MAGKMAGKAKKNKGTRQSTLKAKRRKGVLAIALPWLKRFGWALALCVALLWVGAWLWLSGSITRALNWSGNQIVELTASAGFEIENILVEGRHYSDADTLLALINVQKGDPLFSFNPAQAQKLIERMEWVRAVHVERRLPDTVYIGLDERTPLALWQKKQKLYLLDEEGAQIHTDRLERFKTLITVIGEGAPAQAFTLVSNLAAEPVLADRIETARWIGRRRWDLITYEGLRIKMPEDDLGLAISRLARAQEDDRLLGKDITVIDLRDTSRIVLRVKSGRIRDYIAGAGDSSTSKSSSGDDI